MKKQGGKFAVQFRIKGGSPKTVRVFAKSPNHALMKAADRLKEKNKSAWYASDLGKARKVSTRAQVKRKLKTRRGRR